MVLKIWRNIVISGILRAISTNNVNLDHGRIQGALRLKTWEINVDFTVGFVFLRFLFSS